MLVEPMYWAVFYDIEKPRDVSNAMYKRINRNKFINLTEEVNGKQVYLEDGLFDIISVSTFSIVTSIDNTFFAVLDVSKFKDSYIIKSPK